MMRKFSEYLFVHVLMTSALLCCCIGAARAGEPVTEVISKINQN